MAVVVYTDVRVSHAARPSYSSSVRVGSHYIPNSSLRSMAPTNSSGSTNVSSYPLSALYIKYIRRVWKRVSRATRRPERASVLPDGFVLINNARRKSVLFA